MSDLIPDLWEHILSENPEKIKEVFHNLNPEEQQYVIEHLYKMATEPGWHPFQIQSARTAYKVLEGKESLEDKNGS